MALDSEVLFTWAVGCSLGKSVATLLLHQRVEPIRELHAQASHVEVLVDPAHLPPPRSLHGGAEDLRDLREASEQPCHKARQSIGGSDTTRGKGRGAEAPYPLPFKGPKKKGTLHLLVDRSGWVRAHMV